MFLKICGITRLPDAQHAAAQGATALGFVFWPGSPRYIAPESVGAIVAQLPSSVLTVGVFVNAPAGAIREAVATSGVTAVQLHGDEAPDMLGRLAGTQDTSDVTASSSRVPLLVLRSVTLDEADRVCALWPEETPLVLDAADREKRGGTGKAVDWRRAALLARQRPVVLAGGLTPDNVAIAVETVRPYGVDVSSGVEEAPGVKHPERVARFLANARGAFESRW